MNCSIFITEYKFLKNFIISICDKPFFPHRKGLGIQTLVSNSQTRPKQHFFECRLQESPVLKIQNQALIDFIEKLKFIQKHYKELD